MEPIDKSALELIVGGFIRTVHEVYTNWAPFVVRQDNHFPLHYYLHLLFFVPSELMKRRKMVEKAEVLEVAQTKAGEFMEDIPFRVRERKERGDVLQRQQIWETKYFNFMTLALVDLIEGDSFLQSLILQPERALVRRADAGLSWEDLAHRGFGERMEQLQRIDYTIRLNPEAQFYLALKAGVGAVVDEIERSPQVTAFPDFKRRIMQMKNLLSRRALGLAIERTAPLLEAAVDGYEDRLVIAGTVRGLLQAPYQEIPQEEGKVPTLPPQFMHPRQWQLPPPRAEAEKREFSGIYKTMHHNLQEKLGLNEKIATGLVQAIYTAREEYSSDDLNKKKNDLKESVRRAYEIVINSPTEKEAAKKAAVLSELFKKVFVTKGSSYVEEAFSELYKEVEEPIKLESVRLERRGKTNEINPNPVHYKKHLLCQSLQSVLYQRYIERKKRS